MQGLPQPGDVLDSTYRIEAELGKGGFGAVYLARQISMDREVALKVLVANAMKVDEMIQRFRREVMAVRNLGHPNTIRIYDFRDRADGMLYYAMEYIKGPTLKDVIKEDGPMPPDRVAHILRQVLKSLAEAHSFGIIHRDLKPANIMLAQIPGETDFVKVLDFGIAKILDNEDEEREAITSAGVLVGTLNYMSPEQIAGGDIGPGSDLYALALIGIEMLTGQSVFEGTGRWEILHKQISDEPVEIPAAVIESTLGPVFQKALMKRPHERYRKAEEMLSAMAGIAELSPSPLVTPSEAEEIAETAERKRLISTSGPISNSTPVSHSGPITNNSAVRDSTPPSQGAEVVGLAREGQSGQIRVGAPGLPDESTQQVPASTPDFMPARKQKAAPAKPTPESKVVSEPSPAPAEDDEPPTLDSEQSEPTQPDPDEAAEAATLLPMQGLQAISAPEVAIEAPAPEAPPAETTIPAKQTQVDVKPAEPTTDGGNKKLVMVAGGLVVLVVGAIITVALLVSQGPKEVPADEPPDKTVAEVTPEVPLPPEGGAATNEPPPEPEEPKEQPTDPEPPAIVTKNVRVKTPGVKASLYDGEQLVGETPIRFPVGEEKTFTLKAEGYKDATVALSNQSEETVTVELESLAPAEPEKKTKKKKKNDDWVPILPAGGDKGDKKDKPAVWK